MADLMLGNTIGVTSVGNPDSKLTEVSADVANGFLVGAGADIHKFYLNQPIIFRVKTTGAVFGTTARLVTGITNLGVVNYDGADVTLVPGTHAVYDDCMGVASTSVGSDVRSNQNGGPSARRGFTITPFGDLESLRSYLAGLDVGYFTAARLDKMTLNDMVYAVRARSYPSTIK